jgi:hypothetical protein
MAFANGTSAPKPEPTPAPQPAPEPTVLERGSGYSVIYPKGGGK